MTNSDNKKESSGLANGISIVFFVIVCAAAGGAGKSCARSVSPSRSSASSYSQVAPPLPAESVTLQNVAGLRINLPSRPIKEDISLPAEAKNLMRFFESYQISHSGAMIGISHMIYKVQEVNLDGSADGSISQVRSLPSTKNFTSNKSTVTVSGLEGRRISLSATQGGHQITMHGLVFARGSEAWQIQVMGSSINSSKLRSLSDSIFSSIELSDQ